MEVSGQLYAPAALL